jgi:hypothetical protein
MRPQQARFAFGGFLLLAVGVTVNTLFQQVPPTATQAARRTTGSLHQAQAQHVTRSVSSARNEKADARAVRVAQLRPDSANLDLLPPAPTEAADPETIRAIQRELAQRGYGPIAGDGVITQSMRAAIMAFEYDQAEPLTGEASDALLRRILLGASMATNAGSGRVASQRAEQLVRAAQQALGALGYQPGRIDGQLGEETRRAIREFELDHGLVPKGRISAEIMLRLNKPSTSAVR